METLRPSLELNKYLFTISRLNNYIGVFLFVFVIFMRRMFITEGP